MALVTFPRPFLVDVNGTPRIGAKANYYRAGTVDPIQIWTTDSYDVEHQNPVLSVGGGFFPAVYIDSSVNTTYKLVITDADDVSIYNEDNIPVLTAILHRLSEAEGLAGLTEDDVDTGYEPSDARRYGAVGDGVADDTVGAQRCLDVAEFSGVAYFPATVAYYRITNELVIPNRGSGSGLTIRGDGRLATRIVQETAGQDVFDTNNAWATMMNDVTIRDMSLEGLGVARYGVRWVAMSRSQLKNVRLLNFITAGVFIEDSIVCEIDGCHIIGNTDGILQTAAPNSIPNSWKVTNTILSSNTRWAVNLLQGSAWLFSGCDVEANAKGGLRILTADGGVAIIGNYFEGNHDTTAGTFDISLGAGSGFVTGFTIEANRFQGSASDANFYPVRWANVNAGFVGNNGLGAGSRFLSFENATGAINCRIGPLAFATGGVDKTNGAGATYSNIPSGFVNQGNALQDHSNYPNDGQNIIGGNVLTYLQTSLAGSSTATRSPNTGTAPDEHNGQPVLKLVRSGGAATAFFGSYTVSAVINQRVRGNWVTLAVDVYVEDASAKGFTVRVTDGVSQTYDLATSAAVAAGWLTYCVTGFFSSATTSISPAVLATADGTFKIANPRLYVGLDLSTMPGNGENNEFRGTAAPAAGTYAVGDWVHDVTPVSGQPIGWGCGTAGTPGTWVTGPNYA